MLPRMAPVDPQVVRTRVAQIISELGVPEAGRRLQMKREQLLRLAAGADVRPGSIALAAGRLGLLVPAPMLLATAQEPKA